MADIFEPDGVLYGIPYRVEAGGSILAMQGAALVRYRSFEDFTVVAVSYGYAAPNIPAPSPMPPPIPKLSPPPKERFWLIGLSIIGGVCLVFLLAAVGLTSLAPWGVDYASRNLAMVEVKIRFNDLNPEFQRVVYREVKAPDGRDVSYVCGWVRPTGSVAWQAFVYRTGTKELFVSNDGPEVHQTVTTICN